jgi:Icc-related predicted phosphoesterase
VGDGADEGAVRLVFISDTHEMHEAVRIPPCDILVHCGDATGVGRVDQLERFAAWCRKLKRRGDVREVVFVAGNHDILLDAAHPLTVKSGLHTRALEALDGVTYLRDQAATIFGVRFYGSPWTPKFYDWAFMLVDEADGERVFSRVPAGMDVLVTHGPPHRMMDECPDGRRVGSISLLAVTTTQAPRIHAFGHIHHSYGSEWDAGWLGDGDVPRLPDGGRCWINASICTEAYKPTNAPIVVDLT